MTHKKRIDFEEISIPQWIKASFTILYITPPITSVTGYAFGYNVVYPVTDAMGGVTYIP